MAALLDYAWLVPALSAAAFVLIALFGAFLGRRKGGWLAVALVGAAGALGVGIFWSVLRGHGVTMAAPHIFKVEWWRVGDTVLNVGTYIDPFSAFMLFVVGVLVTLICLYSTSYMSDEGEGQRRYYVELTLFITGMLGLVVANNYLMLFVFWEIMGLCSYLLIGYWYTKPSAAAAAKKAFLVTRIGDIFLLIGLVMLLAMFGSLDFDVLFNAKASADQHDTLLIANLFIFLGAVGKSAQFPLHVWLPDAMEGPTTVSALIHAATMVKAGVYLVARSFPLFTQTPEILVVVAVIGGFTAIFAASMALVNNDLKRVLAYSTLSQLGYMFLGLGAAGALYFGGAEEAGLQALAITAVAVAVFHLFSHAFFKAGLFLSAGSVGHAVHTYDMREMGGLRKHMPWTWFAMAAGTLSIAGFPFLSGFYSKDALLETVFEAWHETDATLFLALYIVGLVTAFMTAYYMARLYLMTFEGRYRGHAGEEVHHTGHGPSGAPHAHAPIVEKHEVHLHESPPAMTVPLGILGAFAIVGGLLVFGVAGGALGGYIFGHDTDAHFADGIVEAAIGPFFLWQTWLTVVAMAAGFGLAWTWWNPSKVESNIKQDHEYTGFAKVLQNRYYIDRVYDGFAERVVVGWAKVEDWFDRNVIDGVVNGVGGLNLWGGRRLRRWNTGNVQDYALTFVAGVVLLILLVLYAPYLPGLKSLLGGG